MALVPKCKLVAQIHQYLGEALQGVISELLVISKLDFLKANFLHKKLGLAYGLTHPPLL
jgi:hypothetical protein